MKVQNYRGQLVSMIQPKMDGWRYNVITGETCQCLSRSQGVDVWEKLFHCHDISTKIVNLPHGCAFVVELHAPGVPATSVPTMIANNDPRLEMTVLSIDQWVFKDFTKRSMKEVHNVCEIHELDCISTSYFPEPKILTLEEVEYYCQLARKLEIEGHVVRAEHQEGLYKIKPTRTVDVVVTDWDFGNGRNSYRLGWVEIGVYTENSFRSLGRVGTGFSDADREEFSLRPLTGKVIEVAYDCLAAGGKLRFPRFIRIREDKPVGECTEDQL